MENILEMYKPVIVKLSELVGKEITFNLDSKKTSSSFVCGYNSIESTLKIDNMEFCFYLSRKYYQFTGTYYLFYYIRIEKHYKGGSISKILDRGFNNIKDINAGLIVMINNIETDWNRNYESVKYAKEVAVG